jgi:hypothetical protein
MVFTVPHLSREQLTQRQLGNLDAVNVRPLASVLHVDAY